MTLNATHDLVNCVLCGRDTRSKYLLCSHCSSGRPSYVRRSGEMKGRKARGPESNEDPDVEEFEESGESRYHGSRYGD